MLRFGIVGISATIIYYVVALFVSKLGLVATIANLVGFGAGAMTSFVGHFRYTFKKSDNHFRYLIRFVIVTFFGYVLSNVIIFIALDVNHVPFWLAMLFVVLILPPTSWLCNRYWAFKELN
jgi:putative flippase GtrA